MSPSPSPSWIYEWLQQRLSEAELKQVEPFLHAESWAAPSARQRDWLHLGEELPLRFRLDVDMKI